MLKSLLFIVLSTGTFSAFALDKASTESKQGDNQYGVCSNAMKYYFLASDSEAKTVCSQNSSPAFIGCMTNYGQNTNMHILEAAPKCSAGTRMRIPLQTDDPTYINLNSCPSRMQIYARMTDNRANQICNWDSSPVMQNCLIDLVQRAHFHSEHAIQYCGFASAEYRNKIPNFVACVVDNAQHGYTDVYSNVVKCDDEMMGHVVHPPIKHKDQPIVVQQSPPVVKDQQPVVKAPEVQEEPAKPAAGPRKVPTPVEIKIEDSSKPEVKDQPIDTGSTSNSESLPM
jgi:hypothetical protein